jgi:hypothetical protein
VNDDDVDDVVDDDVDVNDDDADVDDDDAVVDVADVAVVLYVYNNNNIRNKDLFWRLYKEMTRITSNH